MARLHFVKKARKDNPVAKRGESYYWWEFRVGRGSTKHYSKTRPKRSQLTQSRYLGAVYDLQDSVENEHIDTMADLATGVLGDLRDDCEESYNNMPEALQYSPSAELLQERVGLCSEAIDLIEGLTVPGYPEEDEYTVDGELDEEGYREALQEYDAECDNYRDEILSAIEEVIV